MTDTQEGLLSLVRYAIGNASEFDLADGVNRQELFDLAVRQGVVAIALDGAQRSYDENRPVAVDAITMLDWIGTVHQLEQTYNEHWKVAKQLCHLYAKSGIKMFLLKGLGLSMNYPKPNHRPCGDLDIYLYGELKNADVLVEKELGVTIDHGHHIHTVFSIDDVIVENHYDFFNRHAHPSSKKVDAWLKKKCDSEKDNGEEINFPSSKFNAIYIIRHAATHFAAELITLRHVLDWAFFVDKHYAEVDWEWCWEKYRELNMDKFVLAINSICVEYLGFSKEKFKIGGDIKLIQRVLDEILRPEFDEANPKGFLPYIKVRWRRWWANRWKHKIVYPEGLLATFFYQLYAHLMRPATLHS